jgi:hypothetical protein
LRFGWTPRAGRARLFELLRRADCSAQAALGPASAVLGYQHNPRRPVMSARSENLRWLARKCETAAAAAGDPVTKAKLEQEQHQWLLRAKQAEKAECNLMIRPSREGRLRRLALPAGR